MTVSLICGAEQKFSAASGKSEFGTASSGNATPVSSPVHGGSWAFQYNPTNSIGVSKFRVRVAGGASNRALFRSCRFYINIASLPNVDNIQICGAGAAGASDGVTPVFSLRLNHAGTLVVAEGGGTTNTSTNTLTADNLWHRIEFDVGWNSGAGARVFVDGIQWASFSTVALAAQVEGMVGMSGGVNNTSNVYMDDIVWDSSTLGGSVGYDWKCILLLPVSDPASLNSWTVAGGGTSNLWDSVNNIPPSDAVSAGNAIVNAASGGNLDFVATMQNYITGGLGARDTVRSVLALCRDAEDATTGTKAGDIWIASNPTQSAGSAAFDYGDDQSIAPSWVGHPGAVAVSPTVTLTTQPTVTVRKTTSTTRQVDVDLVGIYVEYTPSTAAVRPMKAAVLGL